MAESLGMSTLPDGVTTRGVLLDVAGARGGRWLEPGQGVFPEDLEAAEKSQGVRVEAGDAVFIPAGTPHSYSVTDGPFEFLCLVPNREDAIRILGDEC